IDAAAFPSRTDETKVPHAVCVYARQSAWSEGAGARIDRCRRCNEKTESYLGLSANCSANYFGLWHGHRQGRGAPDSWKALRARVRIWRSVLAHLSRLVEGQFVEHRPVSL